MTTFTLTNDFHNTSVTLRTELRQPLSLSQVYRARRALCGLQGCTCGGDLGQRGKQPNDISVEARGRADGSSMFFLL